MKPTSSDNANANVPPSISAGQGASPPAASSTDSLTTSATMLVPQMSGLVVRTALGVTVALYVLNQSHLLPRPLAAVVSRLLFYPTLPITASKRIGKWVTKIDDTLVLGGAPLGLLDYPRVLKEDYGVAGVINMCEEWRGPLRHYKKLGMEELYLPTTDHFEPSQEDLISALSFLERHEAQGKKVYVHCRAGHGRSGAVAYAWMLLKGGPAALADPCKVNADLRKLRDVRKTLWIQPNLSALRDRLVESKGKLVDIRDEFFRNGEDDTETKKKEL